MIKMKNKILTATIVVLVLAPYLAGWGYFQEEKEIISTNGTIKYVSLEGGFYGIESDKGEKYLPLNLPEEFKKDGLRVWFKAKPKRVTGIYMWGKPVEILEIKLVEEIQNLSQIKVAILYERITDGVYHPSKIRTYQDLVKILKETNPDLVFRIWWRWIPTFESLPSQEEIQKRAISIAEIASNHSVQYAMIGGAPYLMAPLERELKKRGITPLYAFSLRESAEKVEADGSTTKMVVFRHKGFVEVS